ncbi:purine-nucleoside phosphorylase [Alkalispirochaeta alkalica]|uniref:purine-nucleoside phosphorylase n=1 Tax=Alkalispirochaeta alkalica TaxID=46356 RepID=UPI0003AA6E87|nr:purine-nucleoside phosphorylase [Alkalispirochaeta alkalica]
MQGMYEQLGETREWIQAQTDLVPSVGVVLGSGLGGLVGHLQVEREISYQDIPHFPVSTVAGHAGKLVFGSLGSTRIVAMQGRLHYYEGHPMRSLAYPIALMKMLGVKTLVVSNAAGGMNPAFEPGDLMVITDHINLFGDNPLIGLNDERLGPRFPDMTEVYSRGLIDLAEDRARALGVSLKRGVYVGLSGPAYETAAEIRYMQSIGGDAVGMSTVPEAMTARYLGLDVLGISCITNMSTGLATEKHSHQEVLKTAQAAAERFCKLVANVVRALGDEQDGTSF